MSLTYSSYTTDLANLMVVSPTDTNFLTVLPNIIDDAEGRCYRECDFLYTLLTVSSTVNDGTQPYSVMPANTRVFVAPTPDTPNTYNWIVTESISALSTDATPIRTPLIPVSREWINIVYPTATSSSSTAIPLYFAMEGPLTNYAPLSPTTYSPPTVIVGPPPGRAVTLEYTGTIRPSALSSSVTQTYLSVNLPDLFMAASMVFANAYMKNFSAMADDPKAATSWEAHYQTLKQSAIEEEFRKKFGSQAWTSKQPNPIATPPRA